MASLQNDYKSRQVYPFLPAWASNITYVYRNTYWKAVFAFKSSFELTQASLVLKKNER